MTNEVERRPCRIHPNVEHLQRAVCRFDGAPYAKGQPTCGCPVLAPVWRCVEPPA
jgi:hypothetical protein